MAKGAKFEEIHTRATLAKWQLKGNMKTICKYLKDAKTEEEAGLDCMFQ